MIEISKSLRFVNDLTANNIAWYDWTDQTLHWADPLGDGMNMDHYAGPIPAVVHVHGGELPPVLDGGPDSWFTSNGIQGHAYYTHPGVLAAGNEAVYRYPNTQEPSMIWFHDHLLGGYPP
jgi:spore coat protein A